jgi:sirohydrochlorin ferrochelatase
MKLKRKNTMTGILILAHGSRQKETENTLLNVIELVKAELKSNLIEHAFLQFSDNNLGKGLKRLIDQGALEVQVIPYFLFDGVHIREDIPAEIKEFLKAYPDVNQLWPNLGGRSKACSDLSRSGKSNEW